MSQTESNVNPIHDEEHLALLRERARWLAQDPGREKTHVEQIDVVEFRLAGERYGIDSDVVQEVCMLDDLTPVPCTPSFVLGVVNVHGRIISVVDLRKFFQIPDQALSDLNRVIVLRTDEMEFGILADAVPGLDSIPVSEILPPPPTLTDIQVEFLRGVTGDHMVILDGKKILSDRRIVVQEEMDDLPGPSRM